MKQTLKIAVAGVGVGVVSLAGVGLASAHGPGDNNGEGRDEIKNRVAEILGIDVTDLGDALQQAREEHRTAEMDARLDQAVVDGTITQAEADEIRDWLDARPEVFEELKGARGHGGPQGNGLEVRLAELVADGTITQVEADAALEWSAERPEAMSEIRPERPDRGERDGRRGRGHDRGQGRGFEMRMAPGEDGEIGRFGGFMFRLPPGFDGGFGAPDTTPPVDETSL